MAAAKAESKRQKAELNLKDKEAVIDSLKQELAALKDQARAKSSANSAAASSPPDLRLQGPPEKHWQPEGRWPRRGGRGWLREVRDLTKDVREIAQKCTAVQVEQLRGDGEVAVMRQSLASRTLEAVGCSQAVGRV